MVDGAAAFAVHDSPHAPLPAQLHRLLFLHRLIGRLLYLVVFLRTLSTKRTPKTPTLPTLVTTKKGATTKKKGSSS